MLASRSALHSLVILFCLASLANVDVVEAGPIGKVTRVQKQAQVGSRRALVGTPVNLNDRLRTGPGARLQITFVDGTLFTLGENASVVIDRYVFNPAKSRGEMAVSSTTGALRFATGKLGDMQSKNVTVSTPYAALAVRGTEFWMGPIEGHYGALLLKGKVDVSNRGGAVTLSKPGQGTDIGRRQRR
jgi:hypothetical protein